MKRWLSALAMTLFLASPSFAAGKGPEIQIIDNKLSVNVESVSLGRLLRLLDLATGMKSRVPPELANRNISAKFSDLDLADGVRKMFQGQPLDYVVVAGQGIIVTAASQATAGSEPAPVYSSPAPIEQPFVQDFAPPIPQPNQQPATIQTPFGQIPNPRAGQPMPALPNQPLSAPGAQNSLFPQIGQPQQQQQPNQQPGVIQTPFGPIGQPGSTVPGTVSPNPFNSPSPFGTTTTPQQPNNLFNSGPAPMFPNPINTPTPQQRTP